MPNLAIYVHFPFCVRRCLYCDFNTFAGMEKYIPEYLHSLEWEVNFYGKVAEEYQVTSIYLGGGTPSLIEVKDLQELIGLVKQRFHLDPQAEITLEANPGTIDLEYLEGARKAGINRLSLGIQSLNETELKLLGRIHSAEQAIRAFQDARIAGFSNISIDLIYGLPGQQASEFKCTLEKVIHLSPDHISLYALTLDDHVPMAELIRRGKQPKLDDDLAAEMYEMATELLDGTGYAQYEISNWAKILENKDFRSRHNLQYWHNLPYLGLGAGAHGFFRHFRTENEKAIDKYIDLVSKSRIEKYPDFPQIKEKSKIGDWEEAQETIMLGLRLTNEGIDLQSFQERYHFIPLDVFAAQISKLEKQGLVESGNNGKLRLTKKGRLLGNLVFQEFVANPEPHGLTL